MPSSNFFTKWYRQYTSSSSLHYHCYIVNLVIIWSIWLSRYYILYYLVDIIGRYSEPLLYCHEKNNYIVPGRVVITLIRQSGGISRSRVTEMLRTSCHSDDAIWPKSRQWYFQNGLYFNVLDWMKSKLSKILHTLITLLHCVATCITLLNCVVTRITLLNRVATRITL